MKKSIIFLLITVFAVSLIFAGISCKAKEVRETPVIGLSMPGLGVPYFAVWVEAFEEKCNEYDIEYIMRDGEWDPKKQADQIDDLMVKKVDALVIVPCDAAAIIPSLKKAKEEGFIVISSNVMPEPEGFRYIDAFTGPNCKEQGVLIAEQLFNAFKEAGLGEEGNVVIITGVPGYSATIDRTVGFKPKLYELAPNIKVLAEQPGNWRKEDARKAMEDFIVAYGDQIDAVYAHDDTMAVGAWLALEAAGYSKGDPLIFGVGGSIEGLAAVNDGIIKATILQSPSIDGKLSVDVTYKFIKGEEVKEFFNWQEIPVVTVDNVEQYLPGEW